MCTGKQALRAAPHGAMGRRGVGTSDLYVEFATIMRTVS